MTTGASIKSSMRRRIHVFATIGAKKERKDEDFKWQAKLEVKILMAPMSC